MWVAQALPVAYLGGRCSQPLVLEGLSVSPGLPQPLEVSVKYPADTTSNQVSLLWWWQEPVGLYHLLGPDQTRGRERRQEELQARVPQIGLTLL